MAETATEGNVLPWLEILAEGHQKRDALTVSCTAKEETTERQQGSAYRLVHRQEEAESMLIRALALSPTGMERLHLRTDLAILCAERGRLEEAGAEAAGILKITPDFSVDAWGERNPMKDRDQVERDMVALREAGLE